MDLKPTDDYSDLDIQFDTIAIKNFTRKLKTSWSLSDDGGIMKNRMEQELFDKEINEKLGALGFGNEV
jgi:hypothetical protein